MLAGLGVGPVAGVVGNSLAASVARREVGADQRRQEGQQVEVVGPGPVLDCQNDEAEGEGRRSLVAEGLRAWEVEEGRERTAA